MSAMVLARLRPGGSPPAHGAYGERNESLVMGYDTVRGLLESGRIKPRARVATDDLWTAVEWLEAYEGDPDDDSPNLVGLATVAARLRREATRREQ